MLSEAELALIKSAVKQSEQVSRFGMEVLDEAGQEMDGQRLARQRLRQEIETLALREASLKSQRETIAQTDRREESAKPR